MTVVYRATPVAPFDELIEARAKIADMELTLAMARHVVKGVFLDPEAPDCLDRAASEVIERIEKALVGTIHEVKPRAAR